MDVPGFMVGSKVEAEGIIRHGAKMLYAVANATVPKITVITRKAYGAGYYVMNGRAYEPDLIVAWPSAEISVMGAEGAVEIVMRKQVEEAEDPEAKKAELIAAYQKIIDVYIAAGNDMIDDVIDPRETRPTICRALEMAEGKRVERPWKRHGVVPGMSLEDPVVITCSISGAIANREQCPAIPYTPAEYAAEARRIVDEGGVMIHIHARTPEGTPSYEVEDFRAITEAIRAEVGDAVIVNYSTGTIGVPLEKRVAYLRECRPEVAALNMGSMNYAKYSRSRKQFVFAMVFQNPFEEIIELLAAMNELHIKPEHECFDIGHVGSLGPLIDMGVLKPPLHVDCVMGVVGGHPADGPQPRGDGREHPDLRLRRRCPLPLGRDRDLARPVDARRRGAHARWLGQGRARGQPVPAQRRDGALERRAGREGQGDDRRHGSPSGDRVGGPHDAGDLAMSLPLAGIRVLDLSRLLPGGFCSLLLADFGAEVLKVEDTGMGDYIRWSPPFYEGPPALHERQVGAVPVAEPQQALDPPRPQARARPRGAAAAGARARRGARVLPAGRARPPGRGV